MGQSDGTWAASELEAAYTLTPPVEVVALDGTGGKNNLVRVARTRAGQYLWKRYLTNADPARILAEHRLLTWLAGAGLPFAVPIPIPARDGATLTSLSGSAGWHALFAWLPGGPLDRDDPAVIAALGAALGELHGALARLPANLRPPLTPYGELAHVHPRIPDPFALTPTDLGLPDASPYREQLAAWRAILAGLRAFIDGTYRTLPWQVIHGDFSPGNALAEGARITALLDFEFALYDARAIDLASGLYMVTRTWAWEPAASLAMVTAFCGGYARTGRLSPDEIAALPRLMILREALSATWWLGRALAAGDVRPLLSRFDEMQGLVAWLDRHGAALTDTAARALT